MTVRKADESVEIMVEDTGPGLPGEISSRLFEPFVTAGKKDGLGLGLALSLRTVRDHGGDVWTEPARGARFAIRLPLEQDNDVADRKLSSATAPTCSDGGLLAAPRP
jgi:two-component system sensor kinase FixL